jgi:hypothetical protein
MVSSGPGVMVGAFWITSYRHLRAPTPRARAPKGQSLGYASGHSSSISPPYGVDAQWPARDRRPACSRGHRSADGLGESHVGTVQPVSREAATSSDRTPHPVPQLQLALDGEVCEVVLEEVPGVEFDGLGGDVGASNVDQVALIQQLDEGNFHVGDDRGAGQPLGLTFCARPRRRDAGIRALPS